MNQKNVVALSLLWVGLLVVLSRKWIGNLRGAITNAAQGYGPGGLTGGGAGGSGFGPQGRSGSGGGGGGGGSW